jgi:hypothetical protein
MPKATPLALLTFCLVTTFTLALSLDASAQKSRQIASREQARTCLKQEAEIASLKTKGDNNKQTNLSLVKEVEGRSKALDELQAKVDRADVQQVDDFNAKTREHNAFVATVNQQAASMKADTEAYEDVRAKFNANCTNLIITAADRKAVANEKK